LKKKTEQKRWRMQRSHTILHRYTRQGAQFSLGKGNLTHLNRLASNFGKFFIFGIGFTGDF